MVQSGPVYENKWFTMVHRKPSKINDIQTQIMKTDKHSANASTCKEIQTQKTKRNQGLPNKIYENE